MTRRTGILLKYWWRAARRFVVYKVLHADDPPYALAMGTAIGMFMAFSPLMGLQMVQTLFFAWLLRANKLVGMPVVWVSNPVTAVPIYYPCYLLGAFLMMETPVRHAWFVETWRQAPPGWGDSVAYYWDALLVIAAPLWLGCTVVGLITGTVTYFVVKYGVIWYRLRRWGKLIPPTSPRAQELEAELAEASGVQTGVYVHNHDKSTPRNAETGVKEPAPQCSATRTDATGSLGRP